MKPRHRDRSLAAALALTWLAAPAVAQDAVDQLSDVLSFASADGGIRARLSGTLELEGYRFTQPAPAFLDAEGDTLFNPRLTAFLDGQIGSDVYFFAQARADRGFDPGDEPGEVRLDEYALRLTPSATGAFSLQVGKFATVVGNWVPRHLGWDNPLINAPLVYENLTGVWDSAAAPNLSTLLAWAHVRPVPKEPAPATDKYVRLPVIWGPSYTTGAAVSGALGHWNYAAELKAESLASRPAAWTHNVLDARHPTVSARLGYQPSPTWAFGLSASRGIYLVEKAASSLPDGVGLEEYRQTIVGADAAFAWHHVQVWAEVFAARFAIPQVGDADTFSYYLETRYKFTPQWFAALRWNQQYFGRIDDESGRGTRWGADVSRLDCGVGYRFTPHTEIKAQVSWQHEAPAARRHSTLLGLQFIAKF